MKRIAMLLGAISFLVASARADVVVVPNANASVAGNTDNRFPFLVTGGMRYQQVFASSQFGSFTGPELINEMDLRNGVFVSQAFTSTISNIQIALSTTSKAPDGLDPTFANNTGPDSTTVYNGSLTLSSTNAAGPGNTHVFDVVISFQTPFLYNPAAGNLLLDVKNISGANAAVGTNFFDAINNSGDSVSRVFGSEGSPNATSGTADSLGLIVQFEFGPSSPAVPEPTSLVLASLGFVLVGGYGWRARRARLAGRG
ncbi:MAG TPA: PEP-CTERM sorting domain-containing protein [Isosphaeraceae bacterium]|jgi:hypothetical protein|nr:PEP-CTERM sorting domain-containing protein [Isosphaeraceae bacterium]